MKRLLLAGSCVLLAVGVVATQHSATPTFAQATPDKPAQPKGFKWTPAFRSGLTTVDRQIQYPSGKAEITAGIAEFAPGGTNGLHLHPVPTFVYVLEGTLTLKPQEGPPREYGPGQAFVEEPHRWHEAINQGSTPVKIFALFVGQEGTPVTIRSQ